MIFISCLSLIDWHNRIHGISIQWQQSCEWNQQQWVAWMPYIGKIYLSRWSHISDIQWYIDSHPLVIRNSSGSTALSTITADPLFRSCFPSLLLTVYLQILSLSNPKHTQAWQGSSNPGVCICTVVVITVIRLVLNIWLSDAWPKRYSATPTFMLPENRVQKPFKIYTLLCDSCSQHDQGGPKPAACR